MTEAVKPGPHLMEHQLEHQSVWSRGTKRLGQDIPALQNLEQSPNLMFVSVSSWTKSLSLNTLRNGWHLTLHIECMSLTSEMFFWTTAMTYGNLITSLQFNIVVCSIPAPSSTPSNGVVTACQTFGTSHLQSRWLDFCIYTAPTKSNSKQLRS